MHGRAREVNLCNSDCTNARRRRRRRRSLSTEVSQQNPRHQNVLLCNLILNALTCMTSLAAAGGSVCVSAGSRWPKLRWEMSVSCRLALTLWQCRVEWVCQYSSLVGGFCYRKASVFLLFFISSLCTTTLQDTLITKRHIGFCSCVAPVRVNSCHTFLTEAASVDI